MRNKRMGKVLRILLAVLVVLTGVFLIYTGDYYRADDTAEKALESDAYVSVTKTDYGWFFDGPSEEYALVFYPGGKVEETAYAPLLHELSKEGMDVCLLSVPFHLAVLDIGKASKAMAEHEYRHWYVGGHSLGGVISTRFAIENNELIEGVILCAAYPDRKLEDGLLLISVYGSEDRVLDQESYDKGMENAPEKTVEYVIEGGNHSQFGSYGDQKGDGEASISRERQVDETVRVIMEAIGNE